MKIASISLLFLLTGVFPVYASPTQARIDNDIQIGYPIVIQISVALADNKNQWIVPVPAAIGNGQDARNNLYWGALYGIKTYLIKKTGWEKILSIAPTDERILERLVLKRNFHRKGQPVTAYLIADAWDGAYITDTINQFMRYNAGDDIYNLQIEGQKLYAGGQAHLIVYIGHNALMDYGGMRKLFFFEPKTAKNKRDNDAIVLACKSYPYFSSHLNKLGAHPLVLTTGLMAPEAYTLHSAIKEWIEGADDNQVRKAAAESYDKFQKTGINAAKRLFGVTN